MNKINYIQVTEEEYRKALEEGKNLRKSEDLCEHLNKLLGKKCYRYSEMLDLGLIFTDNILSRDYGRTIVTDNNEQEYKFIYSQELSDYFKTVISSIIPEQIMSEKAKEVLDSDKQINEMDEDEIKAILSSLSDFYKLKESKDQPYISDIFTTYLYKLDGKGVRSYIKNNINGSKLAKHILLTSGLSDRASYYSGRGVRLGDLNHNHLKAIFLKLNKLDTNYGEEFIELVKAMPTLGATEFITSFIEFGNNGFKFNKKSIEESNVSLEGAYGESRDMIALASIISIMSRGNDKSEQESNTRYIKSSFLKSISFYIGSHEIDDQKGYSYSRKLK